MLEAATKVIPNISKPGKLRALIELAGYKESAVWCRTLDEAKGAIGHGVVGEISDEVARYVLQSLIDQGKAEIITSDYPGIFTTPEGTLGWNIYLRKPEKES